MRSYVLALLLAAVVLVECGHTFLGTSVHRQLVLHREVKYKARIFQKRIESVNFTLPSVGMYTPRIQGILAYDATHSGATANVTQGGVGLNYVILRLKSERGSKMNFDIYIYS